MKLSTTYLLGIAIGVLTLSSLWSFGRMQSAADAAAVAAEDRALVEADTAGIRAIGGNPSAVPANEMDLSGRIRKAAAAAGVSDQLLSIEPAESSSAQGASAPNGADSSTSMSVFIRFGTLTIRQLGEFTESVSDRGARIDVNTIDLSDPAQQSQTQAGSSADQSSAGGSSVVGNETWSTQVTLVVRSSGATR